VRRSDWQDREIRQHLQRGQLYGRNLVVRTSQYRRAHQRRGEWIEIRMPRTYEASETLHD
jgi:hypothetical protein